MSVRFSAAGSVALLQHALGRVVEVVELAFLYCAEEQRGEDAAEYQGDGQQKEDRPHWSLCRTRRSTRSAPQMTSPLDNGMSSAATSGLMKPAAAADTATAL